MNANLLRTTIAGLILALLHCGPGTICSEAAEPAKFSFREQQLDTQLTVGYAVRLLDMNQDGKLDVAIVDSERILWLENPSFREHLLIGPGQTRKDNVCFAPYDIDGDGKPDFAVGADWNPGNTSSGGTIQWMRAVADPAAPWTVHPIGEEPTTHRMTFADLDGTGRAQLLVSPLLGRGSTRPHFAEQGVRLLSYTIPDDPKSGPWKARVLDDELHVSHNLHPTDIDGDGKLELLVVSFEGVHLFERAPQRDNPQQPQEPRRPGAWRRTRIGTGNQETSPNRGASEIRRGMLTGGRDYLATIEPWHGHQVVVYTRPDSPRPGQGEWLWSRQVLDEDLQWGHAVACANLDDDPEEELIIGVRDDRSDNWRRGLRIYDPPHGEKTSWTRSIIDPGGVAIEDLAAGDLNGDGRVDIVAVGRQTHNVKIYWNNPRE